MFPLIPMLLSSTQEEVDNFENPVFIEANTLRTTYSSDYIMHDIKMVDSGQTFFSMYRAGSAGNQYVLQYNNTVPYQTNINSSPAAYIILPTTMITAGFCFSHDGLTLFCIGRNSNTRHYAYSFTLTTPWDIVSLGTSPTPNSYGLVDTSVTGLDNTDNLKRIAVSEDGLRLYMTVDTPVTGGNNIVQYDLPSPNVLTGMTLNQIASVPYVDADNFDVGMIALLENDTKMVLQYDGYLVTFSLPVDGDSSGLVLLGTKSVIPLQNGGPNDSLGATIENNGDYYYGIEFDPTDYIIHKYSFQ